jgi:hypothetical protein
VLPKCPITGVDDFSVWYTPGVAAPCLAIKDAPERAYDYTNKGNLVAVIASGGSAEPCELSGIKGCARDLFGCVSQQALSTSADRAPTCPFDMDQSASGRCGA